MNDHPLVSCITTTYGRFTSMRRLLSCWMAQDYPFKELVIYNTAPVDLNAYHAGLSIDVYNRPRNSYNDQPWTNVGEIREAAARGCANGDIFCLFDDDDLYLPYHISQGVKRLLETGAEAWKPKRSLHSLNDGETFDYCENTLEASVFAKMDSIMEFGFRHSTGDENLSWYDGIKDRGGMVIDPTGVPSYSYNWGSKIAPHKQSGDMTNPANFENHKKASTDFGDRPLRADWPVEEIFQRIYRQFPECAAYARKQ